MIGAGLLTARQMAKKLYWGQPIPIPTKPFTVSETAIQAFQNANKEWPNDKK
jgi:hypothetical protein